MDRYRVWFGDAPKYNYFSKLAQALKHIRKTKKLDESNSGLEENFDGEWDEWMDMDDQEVHDHLYMYGGKSPYLGKGGEPKLEPVRPSIMDTVSFSREEIVPVADDLDDDEESEEDEYDEIIEPEEENAMDEEDLDERLMNVIGVSPKVTSTTGSDTLDFASDEEEEEEDNFDEEETED